MKAWMHLNVGTARNHLESTEHWRLKKKKKKKKIIAFAVGHLCGSISQVIAAAFTLADGIKKV